MAFEGEGTIDTGAGTAAQEGAEGSAGAAGAEEGGGQGAAADAPPAWAQRLEQTFGAFDRRLGGLEQRIPAQDAEEDDGEEELDVDALTRELGVDLVDQETGQVDPEAQARLMTELVRRELRAEQDRAFARSEEQRRDREADALEERYPQLRDPNVQEALIEQTERFAQAIGQPGLSREPRMIELVMLAQRGAEAARAERPAGEQQDVHLERGTGAGPASAPDDGDTIGDGIVAAIRGKQFRTTR